MSLIKLEKKINSELTTKINKSRINHDLLEIQINKVSLLDVDALIFETDLSKYSFYKKDNLYFTAIKFK